MGEGPVEGNKEERKCSVAVNERLKKKLSKQTEATDVTTMMRRRVFHFFTIFEIQNAWVLSDGVLGKN